MSAAVDRGSFRSDRLDLFWRFVCERQTIWDKRCARRQPPPWTDDPVLRTERFTNVYRELDPGTHYAIAHILEVAAPKPDKVFNVMLYRLIGRAETHAAVGFQRLEAFDPTHLARVLRRLRDIERKPPFTAAYMVSAYGGLGGGDKIDRVARIFQSLHADAPALFGRIAACQSSAAVYEEVRRVYGFGNFLAYQVVVDLLYPLRAYDGAPLLPFSHDDWASAGPGAQRGIRMLLREGVREVNLAVMHWLRREQRAEFARVGVQFPYLLDPDGSDVEISLANIQNCLCEFHKYVKICEGTGRGRRKFRVPSPLSIVQLSLAEAETA